jgi:hypothetical protein
LGPGDHANRELRGVAHGACADGQSAGDELEDLKRLAASELVGQPAIARRSEAESPIVVRFTQHDRPTMAIGATDREPFGDQRGGDPAIPELGQHRHRRETDADRPVVDRDRAVRDVADDAAFELGDR